MPCDYHFRNGAHTHCVCTGYELEFVFCRGLVGRACVSVVNTFLKVDSYSFGDFLGQAVDADFGGFRRTALLRLL